MASLCAALLFSGCSTRSTLDTKIDESPQGAVYLTRVSDRSFQAAHPIKIDSNTIALVLNGILIRDEQGAVRRVFSGSEVGYLAPLISEGLKRAASDQQVRFNGSTTGVLYAYGRSLYVTLTQYRSRDESASTLNRANRRSDPTGFANRMLSFIPEAAKRPDSYLDTRSTENTLVIDWELLALLPPASSVPASAQSVPTPAPSQTIDVGVAEPTRRDAEIEALRKELQEIKKQLAEQQAERARAQPQPTAPPR